MSRAGGVPLARLRSALARGKGSRPLLIAVPAPRALPERVWDALPAATATFWETAEGAWAGLGEAAVFEGEGRGRLKTIAAGLGQLRQESWDVVGGPCVPTVFGGAAFAAGDGEQPPWTEFGDARLVLPRWTYHLAGARAEVVLALGPGPTELEEVEGELEAIQGALAASLPPDGEVGGGVVTREEDEATWREGVAGAQAAIAAGPIHKVVLVRRTHVRLAAPFVGSALLRRLGSEGPGSFRFGFRFGGAVFAGVSPELLVARRGAEVRTEALAASVPRSAGADAAAERALASRLLGDRKQRHEHELVVAALRRELGAVCAELTAPSTPEVRRLRHLLHLSTPLGGRLASEVGLLELAERLHPSPAVAGEPRAEALAFIAAHERHPRGWFAGPVGRVEAGGDGELAVALRSVLVRGLDAYVYAGAGIVAGSHAEVELAETRAKARTCLAALGVET